MKQIELQMEPFNISCVVNRGVLEETRDHVRLFISKQSSEDTVRKRIVYKRIECVLSIKATALIICDVINCKPLVEVEVFNGRIVVFYHNGHGSIIKCYYGDLLNNNCIDDLVSFLVLTMKQYVDNGYISHSSI